VHCDLCNGSHSRADFPDPIELPRINPPRHDALSGTIDISANHDGPYKDSKPLAMTLGAWRFSVSSWASVIRKTCNIISVEHRAHFDQGARTIYGERRHNYFTTDPIGNSYRVYRSALFVEIGLSANNAAELVFELAHRFGYDRPTIDTVSRK
jgi:hypothetical protein